MFVSLSLLSFFVVLLWLTLSAWIGATEQASIATLDHVGVAFAATALEPTREMRSISSY